MVRQRVVSGLEGSNRPEPATRAILREALDLDSNELRGLARFWQCADEELRIAAVRVGDDHVDFRLTDPFGTLHHEDREVHHSATCFNFFGN